MKRLQMKLIIKKYGIKLVVICFWLLLWEIMSKVINQEIFLASPVAVLMTLFQLINSIDFWQTILFSFARIVFGFILAISAGTILAILSYRNFIMMELTMPLMKVIKSIPVASFIILALIWVKATNLSVLISFLMVLPVIYINVGQGLAATDVKMIQMAEVFHIRRIKKIRAIYIPSVMPYFISAISVGLGFCWKSGIAAEVIGIPAGSIGERLYEAKIFLMTKELLAWTSVIIIISMLFEKAVMWIIHLLQRDFVDNVKNIGE